MRRALLLACALVAASACAGAQASSVIACRAQSIARARYRVCELPAREVRRLELRARAADGTPIATIERLDSLARSRAERVVFATNGGIYERPDSATGLLVADGRTYSPLNASPGPRDPCAVANFYCPPNAIFFVDSSGAGLLATSEMESRLAAGLRPRLATQSGPMLVRHGATARNFNPRSESRLIRSGVGLRGDSTVVFAISDDGVNLDEFAAAFRDALRCPDAMFLDGTISQLWDGSGAPPRPGVGIFASLFVIVERAGT